MTYKPLEPIRRREPAVKGVEPIPRIRLLTPAERELAKRERDERRRKVLEAQERQERADHQA